MIGTYWEVIGKKGKDGVAWVYLLSSRREGGIFIECVDALDPRYPAKDKWVIILSSQKGCPVKCCFCDAAFYFRGNLNREELLEQLEVVMAPHSGGDDCLYSKKVKLHFARMGEPAMNPAVLSVLADIPLLYPGVNFIPTIATVAPAGSENWFQELISLKNRLYSEGRFQLQFSINSTDENFRDRMIPIKKWKAREISHFGQEYYRSGDRKITLNYALTLEAPFKARNIIEVFDPSVFLIKITPINPTEEANKNGFTTAINFDGSYQESLRSEIEKLKEAGFEVIISIGSLEEIGVGSNCGQLAFAAYLQLQKINFGNDNAKH
jgi:23S rRNA (adenine2503-C2)-methyltransferase